MINWGGLCASEEDAMSDINTQESKENRTNEGKPNMVRALIGFALYMLLSPTLLFVSAGTLDWPMAWFYVILGFVSIIGSRLISLRLHPDLLRERASVADGEGAAGWDRILVPLVAILAPVIIAVVAGLDHRFAWSTDLPPVVQYIAAFLIVIGYGVSVWAMAVNRFFSAVARIQRDRGHTVVTSGPYRIVRHPSYAGGVLASIAIPFMLNTLWALVPSLLSLIPLIVRTVHEDRMLINDLDGYAEYARKTRFRLFPGIW
jgi:protein-S-isoprenylcysteine O-methyltransferase Ste14